MDDNKTTASTSTTTARTPPTMEATADEGAITCDLPVEERMKDRQIHKAQVLVCFNYYTRFWANI